jgi:hypothetical protein
LIGTAIEHGQGFQKILICSPAADIIPNLH